MFYTAFPYGRDQHGGNADLGSIILAHEPWRISEHPDPTGAFLHSSHSDHSSARSFYLFGEGSPTKIDDGKKIGYPYSNLSTGPSQARLVKARVGTGTPGCSSAAVRTATAS